MTLEDVGFLLLPTHDTAAGRIVRPSERWRVDPDSLRGAEVVVWGREPLASGTPTGRTLAAAAARERAILGLRRRPPSGLRVAGIHRWAPPRLYGGDARNAVRDLLLDGAIIELAPAAAEDRILDAVAVAAGWPGRIGRFRPGSGGGVLVGSPDRILRTGRAGTTADPRGNADALAVLASGILPERAPVPGLLGRGDTAGAAWSVETRVPGRRPARLDPALARQVAAFAGALPRGEGPATAHREDLAVLRAAFPEHDARWGHLAGLLDRAAEAMPAVLRHGDLWAGNLLAERGRLTGVVDWDAWHPAALPGTDLLHAVATEEGLARKEELGTTWRRRPWRGAAFDAASGDYWRAVDLRPTTDQLDAIGHAWWAGQVAATLRRLPALARDRAWLRANVEAVLAALWP